MAWLALTSKFKKTSWQVAAVALVVATRFHGEVGFDNDGVVYFDFAYGGSKTIESLVVLPFSNLSGDPAQEFMADGMTEALIAELSKLEGLSVVSRTSAMQYKSNRRVSVNHSK